MIFAALALAASTASEAEVWSFDCTSNGDAVRRGADAGVEAMKISFVIAGGRLSEVRIMNAPGASGRMPDRYSTDWAGRVSGNGFRLRSKDQRGRHVEPGKIALDREAGSANIYRLSWVSFISGGHILFDDSGTGTCRRVKTI
jgi:hypothetical protein